MVGGGNLRAEDKGSGEKQQWKLSIPGPLRLGSCLRRILPHTLKFFKFVSLVFYDKIQRPLLGKLSRVAQSLTSGVQMIQVQF